MWSRGEGWGAHPPPWGSPRARGCLRAQPPPCIVWWRGLPPSCPLLPSIALGCEPSSGTSLLGGTGGCPVSPMGALHERAWLSVQAAPQLPETGLWGEPYGHNVSGQTNGAGGIPVLPLPSGSSGRRRAQGPASRRLFRHLGVGAMEAPRPQACGRMRIGLWQGPQQSPGCGEEAGGRDTGSQESRLLGRKAFLGLRRLEEGSSSPPWVRADRPGGALPPLSSPRAGAQVAQGSRVPQPVCRAGHSGPQAALWEAGPATSSPAQAPGPCLSPVLQRPVK